MLMNEKIVLVLRNPEIIESKFYGPEFFYTHSVDILNR